MEAAWEEPGLPPFDRAAQMVDMKIANICAIINADAPPILYMTGKTNFRTEIAKTFIYKERTGNKPFHYYNLKAYLQALYDVRIEEGFEADDLMSIEQTKRPLETIICSRDKDLKTVPGWQFGWENGRQPSFGPLLVTNPGLIQLSANRKKIEGYGDLFFYAQCLLGDGVDTVPGLKGCGPVKAFDILFGSESSLDAFKRVLEAYRGLHGDMAEEYLLEMGRCLYMTRELNEDGSPKLWEFPV